jgi:deoxyribonucleoside regulator
MNSRIKEQTRNDLLADVAEMYYLQNKNQAEIAEMVGVTRSMISRLLTEARTLGIVQVRIQRSIQFDQSLAGVLFDKFGLENAKVVVERPGESVRAQLGRVGARLLKEILKPGLVLGLPWGTTVSAVVSAVEADHPVSVKIVQLVGALGARNQDYDGHGLVQRLAEKLGGEGFFLNAPFFGENEETVQALLQNKSIRESIQMAEKCDVALLGIGSMDKEYSSFFNAGYIEEQEFQHLLDKGVVGDVCGLLYDIEGKPQAPEFEKRTVTIGRERLLKIPARIGVASGVGKVQSIIGAIRAGYINQLITSSATARALMEEKL